jgi:hypothetical protein
MGFYKIYATLGYTKVYLENMAFQIAREGMSEVRLYSEENAPWAALINALPEKLRVDFTSLSQAARVISQNLDKDEKMQSAPTIKLLNSSK